MAVVDIGKFAEDQLVLQRKNVSVFQVIQHSNSSISDSRQIIINFTRSKLIDDSLNYFIDYLKVSTHEKIHQFEINSILLDDYNILFDYDKELVDRNILSIRHKSWMILECFDGLSINSTSSNQFKPTFIDPRSRYLPTKLIVGDVRVINNISKTSTENNVIPIRELSTPIVEVNIENIQSKDSPNKKTKIDININTASKQIPNNKQVQSSMKNFFKKK